MMFSGRCESCSLIAKVGFLPPYRKSGILADSSSKRGGFARKVLPGYAVYKSTPFSQGVGYVHGHENLAMARLRKPVEQIPDSAYKQDVALCITMCKALLCVAYFHHFHMNPGWG